MKKDKAVVHSRIIKTIDDLGSWMEEFSPTAGEMIDSTTPLHSYKSGVVGFEIMWSADSQGWYVSELEEEI